jgi:hypothetical protein
MELKTLMNQYLKKVKIHDMKETPVEEIITDKKNTNQETMKLEKMVVEEI